MANPKGGVVQRERGEGKEGGDGKRGTRGPP